MLCLMGKKDVALSQDEIVFQGFPNLFQSYCSMGAHNCPCLYYTLMLTKSICSHFGWRSTGPSTIVKQAFGWHTSLISTMLSTMRRTVRTLSDSDNETIRGVKRIADLSDSDEDMPPLESDEDGPHLASSSSSPLAPTEKLAAMWQYISICR